MISFVYEIQKVKLVTTGLEIVVIRIWEVKKMGYVSERVQNAIVQDDKF
jgi:hypothetical protein